MAVYAQEHRVEARAEKAVSKLQAKMLVSEADTILLPYATKDASDGNPILFYTFNDYPRLSRRSGAPQIRLHTDGKGRAAFGGELLEKK